MNRRGMAGLAAWLVAVGAQAGGVPSHAFDFNGDGRDDVGVYVRASGRWAIQNSSTRALENTYWGWNETTPVPADYDGDGRTDVAVYYRTQGRWYILQSQTGARREEIWGGLNATPVPADYDGDGKADLAWYDRDQGDWDATLSGGGRLTLSWGWFETRPVPADYDGDGRADVAVYHPETGTWYILQTQSGTLWTPRLGDHRESRPVPADYDGDGKVDPAVYTAATGEWQILQSATRTVRREGWGWHEAGAIPADYDGDGKADLAVYNPVGGKWYILPSATGQLRVEKGGNAQARALPMYALGATENIRMHAHGDSITYGVSSSNGGPATGYPIRLEDVMEGGYGGDFVALNYGVPGETTDDGLARLPGQLSESKARVLLIMEGTNDMFFNRPFSEVESNLRRMVEAGLSRGMLVIIATIPPVMPSRRPEQQSNIIAFNPRIYAIASTYNIPVARVFETLTSVPGWENSLMDPETANHPNDAGYEYVRKAFYDALAPQVDFGKIY